MSKYKDYKFIKNEYIGNKIIVGAIKNKIIEVKICDIPNCETEWEEICYCLDNGRLVSMEEI